MPFFKYIVFFIEKFKNNENVRNDIRNNELYIIILYYNFNINVLIHLILFNNYLIKK